MDSENLVLIFDTETSGLWPKNTNISNKDAKYPFVVQLSFIVYDYKSHNIVKQYDEYIKQDRSMDFTAEAFKLTGITKDQCDNGVTMVEALMAFYEAYLQVKHIVGHNINFDKKMIQLEIIRNYEQLPKESITDPWILFNDTFNELWGIKTHCTMEKGKHVCNVVIKGKYGDFKKSPKLLELYQKLFDETPKNLHNSLVDCLVCLKCFIKMQFDHNIPMSLC